MNFVRLLCWLALGAILFVTISPLQDRPDFGHPDIERVAAFWAMGCLYGFAYRDRWLGCLCLVAIAAFGLECAQLLTPDRHAHLSDAVVKAIGGMVGVVIGAAIAEAGRRARRLT